ncbi:MAG: hypothetical protein WAS21_17375 [Geminicoccaceae bacterium]
MSRNAVFERSRRARCALLLLGGLALLAPPAVADEIPFYITNELGGSMFPDGTAIVCGGPWLRRTANCGTPIRNDNQPLLFYSAEINLFSPFGPWQCQLRSVGECDPIIEGLTFCVDAEPNHVAPVELTLTEDEKLTVKDFSPPPCNSAVAAGFLGDETPSGRDRDAFRFDGKAGEKITVLLEPSRSSGGSGKTARLALRDGSGRRLATDAGALPLKLVATLPAAGGYVVDAIEAEADAGKPFRGHFLVTVRSNAGKGRGESLVLGATGETEP